MAPWKRDPFKVWLVITSLSFGVLAVACGTAATPTPAPAPPKAPAAPVVAPTPAPTLVAVPKAAPTATPVPAPAPTAIGVHPGKVTIMVATFGNEKFDPAFGTSTVDQYLQVVHGYLIATNERAELIPGIATGWGFSKDGLTFTVKVRRGAKFHDGTEITAQDVLWTWRHLNSQEAILYKTSVGGNAINRVTEKIELTAADEVSWTTTRYIGEIASAQSEMRGSGVILPKREALHDVELEAAYDKKPIGAGPMKLVRHVPVDLLAFERFDDHYYQPKNGLPEDRRGRFKSLDMRLVPEEATRVAAIRAGEADIAPASLATKKQVEAGGGRLVFGPEGTYVWALMPGCYRPQFPCHDKRVRQALDYAIDKNLIRDSLYGGPEVFQTKGWFAVTPSGLGYSADLDPRPFDPQKARQLLAEAGYPGGKGFGKLILNVTPSSASPLMVEGAQLGADFWRRELGLDVEVKVGEAGTFIKAQRTGGLDGQILWRDNEARTDARNTIRTYYGDPESERRYHEDPDLFKLALAALSVTDEKQIPKVLNDLYVRLREESYEIALGFVNIPWAVGPRIVTWTPFPVAFYPSALHTITLK